MADISKRAPGCDDDCESGEQGERGKRGKRGPRGHDGHDGATGPTGPAGNEVPTPPFAITTTIIYARVDGDDTRGDGTFDNPFQTLQEAVRHVPFILPPGAIYFIDITGIDETLPDSYTLPAWKAPGTSAGTPGGGGPGEFPPQYIPYFIVRGPVNIVAVPQPVALPGGDGIINATDGMLTQDPITSLCKFTLNTARSSWAAGDTIKGKFLIDASGALTNAVIDSVDPTGTEITFTNAFPPGFPLTVMEPSAHLHGTGGINPGAINALNVDCIMFGGLKISSDVGGIGLRTDGVGATIAQLCELASPDILTSGDSPIAAGTNRLIFSWVYGVSRLAGSLLVAQTFLDEVDIDFQARTLPTLVMVVARGCAPLRATQNVPLGGGRRPVSVDRFTLHFVLVDSGEGIEFSGSLGLFVNVDVRACSGNGISASAGAGNLRLENVGSSAPNGGVGIFVEDGLSVSVDEDTSTTQPAAGRPLTGADGDMIVGVLPMRLWTDFTSVAPAGNEYDLVGMNANANDQSTGSRLYQR